MERSSNQPRISMLKHKIFWRTTRVVTRVYTNRLVKRLEVSPEKRMKVDGQYHPRHHYELWWWNKYAQCTVVIIGLNEKIPFHIHLFLKDFLAKPVKFWGVPQPSILEIKTIEPLSEPLMFDFLEYLNISNLNHLTPPMFVWGGSYMWRPWFHVQTNGGSWLVTHMTRKIGVTNSMLRSLFGVWDIMI